MKSCEAERATFLLVDKMRSDMEVFVKRIQKDFEIQALNTDPLMGEAAREGTFGYKEKHVTVGAVIETGSPERLLNFHP